VARRGVTVEEKTVTIRCQRLTADKRYEEVDVEVPGNFFFGNGLAFCLLSYLSLSKLHLKNK
jgi:hypothetical protein